MAEVIAGLYEIEEEIGAGGGGIVYLGRHIRLDKRVVLKADKRTLKAGKDALRREVDMLKGLSHTYIPQVYDFVEENGVVYTVMDFIEGESFDKILRREGKQEQSLAIKWACQLLEAVSYLHRQGEYGILHGDIKPANIMLKPDGDICLIDFNIALALGEDGAVKVGFSRGYASPEHYGAEYIEGRTDSVISINFSEQSKTLKKEISEVTEVDNDSAKLLASSGVNIKTKNKKKAILLDARSDIYSLGATLYHLFSGIKPSQNALEVEPLKDNICNYQIASIIKKSMDANPMNRYQTAEEMFNAFLSLRKNDKRVKKRKIKQWSMAAILSLLFVTGGSLMLIGQKQKENLQLALTNAAYSEEALNKGDIDSALSFAVKSVSQKGGIFAAPLQAESVFALTSALGIYELSDGFKDFRTIPLPSAPIKIDISEDGENFAVISGNEGIIYDSETCNEIDRLPLYESALSDCLFIDNENIIYSGKKGIESFNFKTKSKNWKGEKGKALTISADKTRVAMISEGGDKLFIYNVQNGEKIRTIEFGDKSFSNEITDLLTDTENYIFSINHDGSLVSVSLSDGSLNLYDINDLNKSYNIYDDKGRKYFGGGFSKNYFTVSSYLDGMFHLFSFDLEDPGMSFDESADHMIKVRSTEEGIEILKTGELSRIDPKTLMTKSLVRDKEFPIIQYSENNRFLSTLTEDGSIRIYNQAGGLFQRYKGEKKNTLLAMGEDFILLGNDEDSEIRVLKSFTHEDKDFAFYNVDDNHFEARISEEENRLILFDTDKFFLYDLNGKKLLEKEIQNSETVYNILFFRHDEGSYLEVRWVDGKIIKYSLENGEEIEQIKEERVKKDLEEEFLTKKYKFVNSLDKKTIIIDRENNREIDSLNIGDNLAYVTEVDQGLVLEFVDSQSNRYGYLLDENLKRLAYLPNITDVYKNTVYFDYHNGSIRKEKFYDVNDLISMGIKKIK